MTNRITSQIAPATTAPRSTPARVKLRRLAVDYGKVYPPDGNGRVWWESLKAALGTTSSAFVNASLAHLQAAARLPNGGVSETGMNAALALAEAVSPNDEVEGALAVQMACTHAAAMMVLGRLGRGSASERRLTALGTAASRLLRAYACQIEALRRLRQGGEQYVRVEHVHVNDGGKAVIGNVNRSGHEP